MKQTRTQRAWMFWLGMPGIVRIGVVLAIAIVIGTCAGPSHSEPSAQGRFPVTAICKDGMLIGLQLVAPARGVTLNIPIPPDVCAQSPDRAPVPRRPASRIAESTTGFNPTPARSAVVVGSYSSLPYPTSRRAAAFEEAGVSAHLVL